MTTIPQKALGVEITHRAVSKLTRLVLAYGTSARAVVRACESDHVPRHNYRVEQFRGERAPKVKTARIEVYHVYGTRGTVGADVKYRGRVVHRETANDTPQSMCDKARQWAHQNGFTHTRVSYG